MPSSSSTNAFAVLAAPNILKLIAVPKDSTASTKVSESDQTLNSSTLDWDEVDEFEVVTKKQKKITGIKPKKIEAVKAEHVTKIGYATRNSKRGGKRGGRKPKAATAAVAAPSGSLPKIASHKK